ncbi:MAG: methylmalonyl Co-A mutase-associated GTPase MeaB [Proteobacteria bacterium]|nr:methylmalonyl Co-A mutase-associated GTPase MeaB [Pseudomonadota bacterium]
MKSLAEQVLKSDLHSISRALSTVENRKEGYLDLLDDLYKKGKPSRVIGVTGAPGVGKSTLVDVYINELVARKKKVAVIAVDPSSPFSGGAILGDRIRMKSNYDNVFIRSVATRGAIGGVSDSVFNMIVIFRAAGYEYIIIETVGVGQNEISISRLSDITLLIMSPGSGDDIQMMKAGIMETGDIFVINKSDYPGADEFETFLRSSFTDINNKIIKTSAKNGQGVKELVTLVDSIYEAENDKIKKKGKAILKEGLKYLLLHEMSQKVDEVINHASLSLDDIINGSKSPYSEMKRLLKGGFLKW